MSALERLFPAFALLSQRLRYSGLRCGLRVEIGGTGRLSYGDGVSVGDGTRVELTPGSMLKIGSGVSISRNVHVVPESGRATRIGAGTTIQDGCRIYGAVAIGQRCILAPNVFVSSGTHAFDTVPHRPIQEQERLAPVPSRPVAIHDDCWLGINSAIMPGVTIGRGCVVGANTVVTSDLAPFSIAVGQAARVVRQRLDFSPKARIDADNEYDAPYFYDGFDLMRAQDGPMRASGPEFTLALNSPTPRAVRLAASGDDVGISLGQARQTINGERTVLEFPIENADATLPFLRFKADGALAVHWAELV